MSLDQLDEGSSKVEIDKGVLRIWDRRGRFLVKVRRGANHLYVFHLKTARPLCLTTCKDDEAWRWHECFSHLHFDALRKLSKEDMVRGLPVIKHIRQFRDTCVITKQRRALFPAKVQCAQELLELVHNDLYGPMMPTTLGGSRYFLMLVDDATRYMWVALLMTKDAAADAIKHL
jgi:hypothetical protein